MSGFMAAPTSLPVSRPAAVAVATSIDTITSASGETAAAEACIAEPWPTPSSMNGETAMRAEADDTIDLPLVDELMRRIKCLGGPTPRHASVAAAVKIVRAKDSKAALDAVPLGSRSRVKKMCDRVSTLLHKIETERAACTAVRAAPPPHRIDLCSPPRSRPH